VDLVVLVGPALVAGVLLDGGTKVGDRGRDAASASPCVVGSAYSMGASRSSRTLSVSTRSAGGIGSPSSCQRWKRRARLHDDFLGPADHGFGAGA
jgi:hypothetical protein